MRVSVRLADLEQRPLAVSAQRAGHILIKCLDRVQLQDRSTGRFRRNADPVRRMAERTIDHDSIVRLIDLRSFAADLWSRFLKTISAHGCFTSMNIDKTSGSVGNM